MYWFLKIESFLEHLGIFIFKSLNEFWVQLLFFLECDSSFFSDSVYKPKYRKNPW